MKHISRLVSAQYSLQDGELAYFHYWLHGFYGVAIEGQCTWLEDAKRRRDDHEKECFRHGGQKTSFPEDSCVKFGVLEKASKRLTFSFSQFLHFFNHARRWIYHYYNSTFPGHEQVENEYCKQKFFKWFLPTISVDRKNCHFGFPVLLVSQINIFLHITQTSLQNNTKHHE